MPTFFWMYTRAYNMGKILLFCWLEFEFKYFFWYMSKCKSAPKVLKSGMLLVHSIRRTMVKRWVQSDQQFSSYFSHFYKDGQKNIKKSCNFWTCTCTCTCTSVSPTWPGGRTLPKHTQQRHQPVSSLSNSMLQQKYKQWLSGSPRGCFIEVLLY